MPDKQSGAIVKLVDWNEFKTELIAVRHIVFVEEQKVPLELEIDEMDQHYIHAAAFDKSGQVIATGRMQPNGKIGRMAVLQSWRGTGTGRALLDALIMKARSLDLQSVSLDAQTDVRGFYDHYGFVARGDIFVDVGIEHIFMSLSLE